MDLARGLKPWPKRGRKKALLTRWVLWADNLRPANGLLAR